MTERCEVCDREVQVNHRAQMSRANFSLARKRCAPSRAARISCKQGRDRGVGEIEPSDNPILLV